MRLPSVMSHSFSMIPSAEIPRSSFDRSHGLKTTFDSGWLVPVFVDEVLPGDTFNLSMTAFARLSTPIKPLMDNIYLNSFFFFVPNRLIWTNWQRFNGEQDNPGDSTDYLVPQVVSPATTGFEVGTIHDYFGLPTGVPGISVCGFWHRAYNLIWNEWFRDENLQDSVVVDKSDGPDDVSQYQLLRRGKRHDYFTSCLPWPQKGESVSIPLGQHAPLLAVQTQAGMGVPTWAGMGGAQSLQGPPSGNAAVWYPSVTSFNNLASWNEPGLVADLSEATSSTINQLRQAFQIQRLYERDARGGTRYTEIVRAHFGVVSPDARLQRPEYLGGGQSPVLISQVPQTGMTNPEIPDTTPQGNLAAFGTLTAHGHGFSKSFTEHGVLLGLISVRADLTYQRGVDRKWSRKSRFDFYWPALSHIGEQAVFSKEIFADGTTADDSVFGYQERYAEYRYKNSHICGEFRSNYAQSLDIWHLSEDFTARPLLNNLFIQSNPPIDRVIAVPTEPQFIGDFYFSLRCARPMPVYGVPGMIDHF